MGSPTLLPRVRKAPLWVSLVVRVKTLCYQSKRCRFNPWAWELGSHIQCGVAERKREAPFVGHRIKHSSLGLTLPVAAQPGQLDGLRRPAVASQAQPLGPVDTALRLDPLSSISKNTLRPLQHSSHRRGIWKGTRSAS